MYLGLQPLILLPPLPAAVLQCGPRGLQATLWVPRGGGQGGLWGLAKVPGRFLEEGTEQASLFPEGSLQAAGGFGPECFTTRTFTHTECPLPGCCPRM